MFDNKKLLITGGTGNFGNAVLNRFLHTDIAEDRIFSRDEKKQHDMRLDYGNNRKLKFTIGDVRRPESLLDAMSGVDFVFHAAALKQAPSCEFYPMEALLTNTVGAENDGESRGRPLAIRARWDHIRTDTIKPALAYQPMA